VRRAELSIVRHQAYDHAAAPILLWYAPAKYRSLNAPVSAHASPRAIAPLAQERNNVRADVIFAKDLKRLVGRRRPFMNKAIDARLSCCHRDCEATSKLKFAYGLGVCSAVGR
jgi:hypothetical protein